jgi:L-gulono-1,4-lactone dehydrogenase
VTDARLEWTNWAGDQKCSPAAIVRPGSLDEVIAAVTDARARDLTVRVAGAGHSFIDTVLTSGMLLSLERMNHVLEIDRDSGLVRVEAGISMRTLSARLDDEGLALPNLGDIDVQSLAGATATGTHGTGLRLQNMSAGIVSMELVRADGSVIEVSENDDADAWCAARVSIGALGIITTITLKTVPAFTLHAVDRPQPLIDVLENIDELAESNDHFEFYNFPYSDIALTRVNNRVEGPPQPRTLTKAWIDDVLIVNHLLALVCRTGRRLPWAIPRLNRLAPRLAGTSERVDRSYLIFSSRRDVRFTEMEYALPRAHAGRAVRAVRAIIEGNSFSVPLPLEVRFVAADDAYLSPAYGRETCYLAVHMFEGMEWNRFFRSVEAAMVELGGRPHWGKRHFLDAFSLSTMYPEWERFAAVRARLDPLGGFANAYVERVLGLRDDSIGRSLSF